MVFLEIVVDFVSNVFVFDFLVEFNANFLFWLDHYLIGKQTNELSVSRGPELIVELVLFVLLIDKFYRRSWIILLGLSTEPEPGFLNLSRVEISIFGIDKDIVYF